MITGMARPRPGFKHDGQFKPGNSVGSRGGRAKRGSISKTPANIWKLLAERGDKDPLDVLSSFQSSELVDPTLRVQSAVALAGYKHGKRSALRWVEGMVGVKAPTNVAEACAYLGRVFEAMSDGRVDVDAGNALRDTLLAYINARTSTDTEERLRVLERQAAEIMLRSGVAVAIPAEGTGLPIMPGCEGVRFPQFDRVIEHKPANPWASPAAAEGRPEASPAAAEGRPEASEPGPSPGKTPKTPPEPR
jgi:hypothetical protein